MGRTIAEKILGAHAGDANAKAGDVVVASVDFAMLHDARASNALQRISQLGAKSLPFASRTAFVLDHYSPPPHPEAANIHREMRAFSEAHGTHLYDVGDGICHQVLPEGGHFTCGDLVTGTDTHSTTYGAFNAFGTGVEGTDLAAVMLTGKLWFRVPETIRVELKGKLQPGVWAKDITLQMLGRLGAEGANYHAIEYAGSAVGAMEIDDRMTLSNHAAELGAKAALLEADAKTIQWLKARGAREPKPVSADADARYVTRIEIDTAKLPPQVARKHRVDDVVDAPELKGQRIHYALIGTCTNGRLDDLRQAAAILKGRHIAKGVRMIVTPASRHVYLQAAREGLIEALTQAGASVEAAGCGTCVNITGHLITGDGDVVITSANRNFKGRLGNSNSEIFIGSSATVAASALTGFITDAREVAGGDWRPQKARRMTLIKGRARLLGDDINTDLHCSSKYHPGRDNAYVAQHAFEQLVPGFASRFAKGDVIVAGRNFGNNSSREQAVHILHVMGVSGLVAVSFGRQFFRNCINNAMPAVECELPGVADGDEIELDLAEGRVRVRSRGLVREVPPLPPAARAIIAAGGLIPFLKAHPDWKVA